MGKSIVNEKEKYTKCIKFAKALKSRGYKMRIGLDKDNYLKLGIFPADKRLSFVEDYVKIGYYPIMEDGYLMGWKFGIFSKMDKETFISLSPKELNAVVTARNDLLYFSDLLNSVGFSDKDAWNSKRWYMYSDSFVGCMFVASLITRASILRDVYRPGENPKVKVV